MRYLVTGGAGFIGSHLVSKLLDEGHEVTVIDNFSTGSEQNLAHVADRVNLIQGSILDPLLVDEHVSASDAVFHLAAAVGVKLIVDRALHSFITNIKGTENVLEAAHRYRRKTLIASTSEIYGKNEKVPFKETDDRTLGSTTILRWGYSTSKAVDEILAFAYHRERDLPTVVVRLFNTVGPRQTAAYGMVIPRFVEQALANEPLTVYDDGKQTRCFCDVRDVVEGLYALMETNEANGDVFNIGSTEEVSILEVAQRVIEIAGSSSQIEYIPYEQAYERGFEDMRRRVPDISKIGEAIGWKPTRDLTSIIGEIVAERRERSRA